MRNWSRQFRVGMLLFSMGLYCPRAWTQTVSDYRVEAAYIYNFAKFIEWPPQNFPAPMAPMRFCVLNDRLFELELDRIVKDKSIAGRSVQVVQVQDGEQSRNCQVLFIASAQNRQMQHLVETLRGTNVLTVGEADDFIQQGGIIHFIQEDDRVQFEINHRAATDAGLYISSRLLEVAKRVIK